MAFIAWRDFKPTQFDIPLEFLPDKADWFVHPIRICRFSPLSAKDTFEKTIRNLVSKGTTHEVHRFGHWLYGWFEVILIPSK